MVELSTPRSRRGRGRRRRARRGPLLRIGNLWPLVIAALLTIVGVVAMTGVFWLFDVFPFLIFLGVVVAYAVESGVSSSSGSS